MRRIKDYHIETLRDGEWTAGDFLSGPNATVVLDAYDEALNQIEAGDIAGLRVVVTSNGESRILEEEVREK